LARNPGLELLFLLKFRGDRLGFVTRAELADANAENRPRRRRADVRRIAFGGQTLRDRLRLAADVERRDLNGEPGPRGFVCCRRPSLLGLRRPRRRRGLLDWCGLRRRDRLQILDRLIRLLETIYVAEIVDGGRRRRGGGRIGSRWRRCGRYGRLL